MFYLSRPILLQTPMCGRQTISYSLTAQNDEEENDSTRMTKGDVRVHLYLKCVYSHGDWL